VEIRRNGAVLKVREDSQDKVFVPGWKRQLANSSGVWLSTMSGECIGQGDLVAYYVDVQEARPGYAAVGKNVMVLKESQDVKMLGGGRRRRQSTERSDGAKYGNDTTGDEMEPRRRVDASDSDSGSECGVSDGELEWLEKDIGTIIAKEDPQAKTLKLLSDVQSQLCNARSKKEGPKKKGVVKSFRAGYTPMGSNNDSFWRMKKLLASVEVGYKSEDDPDYEPGDEVEQVRRPRGISETAESSFTSGLESSVGKLDTKRERMDSIASSFSVGKRSDRVRAESSGKKLPYWVRAVSLPEKFDPELGKFVAIDKGYSEDKDPDYALPESDIEIDGSEEEDEELEQLVKEALEELPEDLKSGKYKTGKVVSPVKLTLTPSKEGDEEPKEEILTLDMDSDDEIISEEKPPGMWVKELMLKEQSDDYDSEKDPEYVPPSIIYETDKEYDEYSDGGDAIPKEEVESLLAEQKKPLAPPSTYIPIWVPVASPEERIARAKEQIIVEEVVKNLSRSETDVDSNGKKGEEVLMASLKLNEVASGLTPTMKKLTVNQDETDEKRVASKFNVKAGGDVSKSKKESEVAEVPKPKREKKKSKGNNDDVKLAENASKEAKLCSEEDPVAKKDEPVNVNDGKRVCLDSVVAPPIKNDEVGAALEKTPVRGDGKPKVGENVKETTKMSPSKESAIA